MYTGAAGLEPEEPAGLELVGVAGLEPEEVLDPGADGLLGIIHSFMSNFSLPIIYILGLECKTESQYNIIHNPAHSWEQNG